MELYNTEDLWKQLLFYGEYHIGAIGIRPKKFCFYIDAQQYDPEGILFQIHRNFLNFFDSTGTKEEISPEAFKRDSQKWFRTAIAASLEQYFWETEGKNPYLLNSSTTIAKEYNYQTEQVLFSKCGLKFIKIKHQSLKRLALYPQALDVK